MFASATPDFIVSVPVPVPVSLTAEPLTVAVVAPERSLIATESPSAIVPAPTP